MKHLFLFSLTLAIILSACSSSQPITQATSPQVSKKIAPLVKVEVPSHSFDLDRLKRLDQFLEAEMAEDKLPGAVLLIHEKGQQVYYKSLGAKEKGVQLGMPQDELFYIQSMTKPIISVAFMMLYEEGHFQLNDPIAKFLTEFAEMSVANSMNGNIESTPASKPITIKHALTHTGGMLHGLNGTDLGNALYQKLYLSNPSTIEERVKLLASSPLIGEPGEQWQYSASPDILARLIEVITGQSPDQFLQERLFGPLGMTDTGYNIKPGQEARKAILYSKQEDGTLALHDMQTEASGYTVFGGTHGLFSTAKDYMKFCDMLLNNGKANGQQLIGRKTLELMTTDHLGEIFFAPGYGFGLGFAVVNDVAESGRLATEGTYFWNGAYNTYFFIDPVNEVAAVLMMQFYPYDNKYAHKLRHFVTQALID